ncbi:MAG: transposase [Deefgea sp.]
MSGSSALMPLKFSLDRLSVQLKERGLSFKRTRLSLKKRDQAYFDRFAVDLAGAKQLAKAETIDLLFMDESGFATIPNVLRNWSPRGKPHTADAGAYRKRVNVLGALNYRAESWNGAEDLEEVVRLPSAQLGRNQNELL